MATSVYALFRYHLNQKLKAFQLRNAISRDLHDDVGATLSSIGFFSTMALDDVADNNLKMQNVLRRIKDSSQAMLDAMNDIIWNIQPENDTIDNVIARMIFFASEVLEAKKITLHYNVADNIKHLRLSLAVRHELFLIFKEAINNLAKYSEASEAAINLELHHAILKLVISDNGKGFDPLEVKTGNGLKNMQYRAEKIGAVYQLDATPGGGTSVRLHFKTT